MQENRHKWLKCGACALLALALGVARADGDWRNGVLAQRVNGVTWFYEPDPEKGWAVVTGADPVGKSLVIPSELGGLPVRGVADWAFEDSDRLESVTIPESVMGISGTAFAECERLRTFAVDSGNERLTVKDGMLMSRVGDTVTVIRVSSALTSVTVPDGVTVVDSCAFDGLTKLTTVYVGASVEKIGDYAFSGCSALKTIAVDAANEFFTVEDGLLMTARDGERRLVRAGSALASVVIPDGTDAIGPDAFSGIKGLKSVSIPEGVREIGESAFDGCAGLTSATIPDSVERIGESAFEDCSKLGAIVIGAGVKVIEDSAFEGCKSLKKVVFMGNRPDCYVYWDEDDDDDDPYEELFEDAPSSCVIFVQEGSDWNRHCEKIPGTWYGHRIRYSLHIECEGLETGAFTAGVNGGGEDGICLDLPASVKSVSVKGLPAGMKLAKVKDGDGYRWTIVGAPAKSGAFTATISVTMQDGTKDEKSIAFTVDAMSPMAVGTFRGFIDDGRCRKCGTVQLTATAAGKLSAKVVTAAGTFSFSASAWDSVSDGGVYRSTMTAKKGERLAIAVESTSALNLPSVRGEFAADADSGVFAVRASRNLLGTTWHFVAEATGDGEGGEWRLDEVCDAKDADLTLSIKGDGTTALKGRLGTVAVNASGFVDFSTAEEGCLIAEFAPVVSVRDGKKTVKRTLSISLDIPFSQEEPSYGSAELVGE